MTKHLLAFTSIVILLQGVSYGQTPEPKNRAGSVYSSIGPGQPVDLYAPVTAGLGMAGVSTYDAFSVNSTNPALWGVGNYTQGVITFDFQRFLADDGVTTGAFNSISVDQFQLVLPVVRSRVGISAGFQPVTRSGFTLRNEGSIQADELSVGFENSIFGTGGVNRAEVGIGFRITDRIAAGYGVNLHFASFTRDHQLEFDVSEFSSVNYNEGISGHGLGHRFGLYLRNSNLLGQRDEIAFGATVTLPVSFGLDREMTSFRVVRNDFRLVELLSDQAEARGELELPLEINLGLTYNPSRLFSFTTEYLRQSWGDARFSFYSSQEQYLADRSKIGIGSQFHPYRLDGSPGFFSRFRYGVGLTRDDGHLEIGGEKVQTWMFHAGVGVLSQRTASSIDLSFQIGSRGGNSPQQISETIWGFKISLNLAEIMFVPPMFQ